MADSRFTTGFRSRRSILGGAEDLKGNDSEAKLAMERGASPQPWLIALNALGADPQLTVDGLGRETRHAVMAFQCTARIAADGIAGGLCYWIMLVIAARPKLRDPFKESVWPAK